MCPVVLLVVQCAQFVRQHHHVSGGSIGLVEAVMFAAVIALNATTNHRPHHNLLTTHIHQLTPHPPLTLLHGSAHRPSPNSTVPTDTALPLRPERQSPCNTHRSPPLAPPHPTLPYPALPCPDLHATQAHPDTLAPVAMQSLPPPTSGSLGTFSPGSRREASQPGSCV